MPPLSDTTYADDFERLQEALRQARELLSIAPAFFGFLDRDGALTGMNDLSLAVIEARREELLGMPFWEAPWWAPLPDSAAQVREAVRGAAQGRSFQMDLPYWSVSNGQGSRRWVSLEVRPFSNAYGMTDRIAVTGIDITDRKETEAALVRSEKQFARAVAVSRVGFYDWDILADRLVYSEQFRKDWGVTSPGTIAEAIERIHPDDRKAVDELIDKALNGEGRYRAEYRVVRPDGTTLWVDAQGEILYDEHGRPLRFFGTSIDISERRQIREQLEAERQKFEAIFVESETAMALLRGPDFVFEKVNPEYEQLMAGRSLTGKTLHEALPELVGQPFLQLMTRVFETGETYRGREMIARLVRRPGGEPEDTYFDFNYTRISDGAGHPYGIFIHAINITDKVIARKNLEQTKASLETAVQNLERERDLREQFVATLSHDLRNPLTSAKMASQLMMRRADDAPQVRRLALRISESLDRADHMIRDLLDANRIKAGEPLGLTVVPAELVAIATAAIEDLVTIHGDRFVLRAPPAIEGIWAPDAVRRILENLASNAIKYGAPSRPVTVTLTADELNAEIAVHNEGPPIPEADLRILFQPFRRTGTAARAGLPGWGLGLTLVRGLTEAHGGEVSVESSEEVGTIFRARLPRQPKCAPET